MSGSTSSSLNLPKLVALARNLPSFGDLYLSRITYNMSIVRVLGCAFHDLGAQSEQTTHSQ